MTELSSDVDQELGETLEPDPRALIQSMRNLGYTAAAAIADLIDNSITAQANDIQIRFEWAGQQSWIAIVDDGQGMDIDELRKAMRPGSRSPLEQRERHDLGRFGLGLKTASFSQSSSLTVCTKQGTHGEANLRCWDLEHVQQTGRWSLLFEPRQEGSADLARELLPPTGGTVVLWDRLDRLMGDGAGKEDAERHFWAIARQVDTHVGMVFHRMIGKRLAIRLNGHPVQSWDPFLESHPKTEPQPSVDLDGGISVKPFVLPHRSHLTEDQVEQGKGPNGWNDHQGFFIYRNKRLLVPGTWLDYGFTKEEHHKLARIRIDLPNDLDLEWQIDLMKSSAVPPSRYHRRLKVVARSTRRRAREIYSHRGRVLARSSRNNSSIMWLEHHERSGGYSYTINRKHPVIQSLRDQGKDIRLQVGDLLRMIESTVPLEAMLVRASEEPDMRIDPVETMGHQDRMEMMRRFLGLLMQNESRRAAFIRLTSTEPFTQMEAELEILREEIGINVE